MREEIASFKKRVKRTYINAYLRQAESALDDIESLISKGSFAKPKMVAAAAETFFEVAENHLKIVRDVIQNSADE